MCCTGLLCVTIEFPAVFFIDVVRLFGFFSGWPLGFAFHFLILLFIGRKSSRNAGFAFSSDLFGGI